MTGFQECLYYSEKSHLIDFNFVRKIFDSLLKDRLFLIVFACIFWFSMNKYVQKPSRDTNLQYCGLMKFIKSFDISYVYRPLVDFWL